MTATCTLQADASPASASFETYPFTVASFDVGGTKIGGALVRFASPDESPRVIGKRSVPTDAFRGGDAILDTLSSFASALIAEANEPVFGIGVGTAGHVDSRTGSIAYANEILPGWTGQPVAARLAHDHHLPVAVLNDVQAHALGEARWGAAQGSANCLMIAVGTGLGGGIIAEGRVLRGHHGFAGELGHSLHPAAAGITCVCGGVSHLESVASGSGIEARYREAGGGNASGGDIAQRARDGETLALRIIEQAGESLGEAIASWACMLDPQMVILAGSVCRAGKPWRDALERGFQRQIDPSLGDLPMLDAALGDSAALIGAAENLMDTQRAIAR